MLTILGVGAVSGPNGCLVMLQDALKKPWIQPPPRQKRILADVKLLEPEVAKEPEVAREPEAVKVPA